MNYAKFLIKEAMTRVRRWMRTKATPRQTAQMQQRGYLPSPEQLTAGIERGNINLAHRLGVAYELLPKELRGKVVAPTTSYPTGERVYMGDWKGAGPALRGFLPKRLRSRVTPVDERAFAAAMHRHELTEVAPSVQQIRQAMKSKVLHPTDALAAIQQRSRFYSHASPKVVAQEPEYIAGLPEMAQRAYINMRTKGVQSQVGVPAQLGLGARTRHLLYNRHKQRGLEPEQINQALASAIQYHHPRLRPDDPSHQRHVAAWNEVRAAAAGSPKLRAYLNKLEEAQREAGPYGLRLVLPKDIKEKVYYRLPSTLPKLTTGDIAPLEGGFRKGPMSTELIDLERIDPRLLTGVFRHAREGTLRF